MSDSRDNIGALVDHLFRNRAGQMVAWLTRRLGAANLAVAEEAVQEALLKALQHWPYSGVPENPGGWLFRVARNAALDAVRRSTLFKEKEADIVAKLARAESAPSAEDTALEAQLRDDELRMLFLCCHPALPREARVALSLKLAGGFSVGEIARAFLAEESAIAQRLVRAKRQIREMNGAFELPAGELAARLDSVLEALYLMFNEGYAAHAGEDLIRLDVCGEALRLARLLADSSLSAPRVHALVALTALQAARLPARVDDAGDLVLLEDQDHSRWDQRLIALGFHHFTLCAEGGEVSQYHVQAAIAAVHAGGNANWAMILDLYDQLVLLEPSPVVALNRAVAVARVQGPAIALEAVEKLTNDPALRNYHLLPAVRGRLLLELGDRAAAADLFREAMARPCSEPERRFLARKLAECC